MNLPAAVFLGFILALPSAPALAGMADALPAKAWRCVEMEPAPRRAGQQATFYFFDAPIAVERYTPGGGIDGVDGISAVVRVIDGKGAVYEYVFGQVTATYLAYEMAAQFSARRGAEGFVLVTMPPAARTTVIDRITGEMRAGGDEPGGSNITCETVAVAFGEVARDYERLIRAAIAMED